MLQFKKAELTGRKLRMSIQGPSGSGKTTTALRIAAGIAEQEGGRIALIDSEDGRARLEAARFDFDHCELVKKTPDEYVEALRLARNHTVVIIDSASHEWEAILKLKDALPESKKFTGWAGLNPKHEAFFRAMLEHPAHTIVTMRSEQAYVLETQERDGRKVTVPVKVGMEPIMRKRSEYEFDIAIELDHESKASLAKRPRGIFRFLDGWTAQEPGEDLGQKISEALTGLSAIEKPRPSQEAEEKARLLSELATLETLFGGRQSFVVKVGPWPTTIGEARAAIEHAEASLAQVADAAPIDTSGAPEAPPSSPQLDPEPQMPSKSVLEGDLLGLPPVTVAEFWSEVRRLGCKARVTGDLQAYFGKDAGALQGWQRAAYLVVARAGKEPVEVSLDFDELLGVNMRTATEQDWRDLFHHPGPGPEKVA